MTNGIGSIFPAAPNKKATGQLTPIAIPNGMPPRSSIIGNIEIKKVAHSAEK